MARPRRGVYDSPVCGQHEVAKKTPAEESADVGRTGIAGSRAVKVMIVDTTGLREEQTKPPFGGKSPTAIHRELKLFAAST